MYYLHLYLSLLVLSIRYHYPGSSYRFLYPESSSYRQHYSDHGLMG